MAKKILFATLLTILPLIASAHERQVFRIGDKTYAFVVGFANEPVFVDDKSGVDLRVRLADPADTPVEGLDKSLKVEVSANDKKKTLPFEAAFRDPGLYHAWFFPTAATTYQFRVTGELNGVPINLTFSCVPAHGPSAPDKSEVKVSEGVTRIFKSGAFGCPLAKDAARIP